jgi:phosphoglycolate phosphatase
VTPAPVGFDLDMTLIDSRAAILGSFAGVMRIYRTHYLRLAGPLTRLLPGALESLAVVRAAGASAVVITAKFEVTARLSLDALGLVPDAVYGGVHGPEKATVLTSVGAAVYVGDTPADMAAAVTAGARPVGVATGSFTGEELRGAGAVNVLVSLRDFPALYQSFAA